MAKNKFDNALVNVWKQTIKDAKIIVELDEPKRGKYAKHWHYMLRTKENAVIDIYVGQQSPSMVYIEQTQNGKIETLFTTPSKLSALDKATLSQEFVDILDETRVDLEKQEEEKKPKTKSFTTNTTSLQKFLNEDSDVQYFMDKIKTATKITELGKQNMVLTSDYEITTADGSKITVMYDKKTPSASRTKFFIITELSTGKTLKLPMIHLSFSSLTHAITSRKYELEQQSRRNPGAHVDMYYRAKLNLIKDQARTAKIIGHKEEWYFLGDNGQHYELPLKPDFNVKGHVEIKVTWNLQTTNGTLIDVVTTYNDAELYDMAKFEKALDSIEVYTRPGSSQPIWHKSKETEDLLRRHHGVKVDSYELIRIIEERQRTENEFGSDSYEYLVNLFGVKKK